MFKGMNEVFISYKSEEFDLALWVKNNLEQNGISCWMAPMSISGGASYAVEIPEAIKNCKAFVLILSELVQQSKWVPRELDQAINSDKLILPFMIENCAITDEFSFYLGNVQRYYAYEDKNAAMDKLVLDLKSFLGIETATDPEPFTDEVKPVVEEATEKVPEKKKEKTEKKPKSGKKKPLPFILGGVALLLAAAITAIFIFNPFGEDDSSPKDNPYLFGGIYYTKFDYSVSAENVTITEKDIANLVNFAEISYIYLENCEIKTDDLSILSQLDLYKLVITGCNLTDTQLRSIDFSTLDGLRDLDLSGNANLSDFSGISSVSDSLTSLSVSNTAFASPEMLSEFTELCDLYLDGLGLNDLGFASELIYLDTLSANDNNLTGLGGLENTTVLKEVYLNNNKLTSLSLLKNSAESLTDISLDGNNISDLSDLSDCKNIKSFSANGNKLTDTSWAKNWSSLIELYLANNNIEDLSGLSETTSLKILDLSGNKLKTFEGIAFIQDGYSSVELDLSYNEITTLSLPKDVKFGILALHENPLTSAAFLTENNGYEVSLKYFDGLSIEVIDASPFSTVYITDCPLNKKVDFETLYKINLYTAEEIDKKLFD